MVTYARLHPRGPRRSPQEVVPLEDAAADGTQHVPHAILWEDDPNLTVCLQFFCDQVGLRLDLASTAEGFLASAKALCPEDGAFLIVDCTTMATALARASIAATRTALPVHICHPREGFVDDLHAIAHGAVHWLPPEWVGLALLDRLRGLQVVAADQPAEAPVPTGAPLAPREQEVLHLVAEKLSNAQIAARLGLSENTVRSHLASIRTKLGLHTRRDMIRAYRPDWED